MTTAARIEATVEAARYSGRTVTADQLSERRTLAGDDLVAVITTTVPVAGSR